MLYIIFYVCISLSILGSSLMITHLFLFDHLKQFPQRIVACLSISDFIFSSGLLLYVEPEDQYYDIRRCHIQGAITQFGSVSAFIWSTSIAILLNISTNYGSKNFNRYEKYQKTIYVIGYSIPLILALIPFIFQAYAPTPNRNPVTCSIRSDDSNKTQNQNRNISLYLNLFLFYIPLVCCVLFSFILITITYRKIKKIKSQYELLTKQLNIQLVFVKNLTLYPIALMLCWLPSYVAFFIYLFNQDFWQKIQQEYFTDGNGPFKYIRIIQYSTSFLQGFCNSLVYWYYSYKMRKELKVLDRTDIQKQKTQTLYSNNYDVSIRSSQVSNSLENLQDI